jgi:4-amino-4-deoxy-L-arabinose transferase-like glycosyltransferase
MRPGPLVAGEVTDKKSEPPDLMSGSFLAALRGKALSTLAAVLAVAFLMRLAAALVLQWFVQKSGHGRLCVFPDTEYYWLLARAIRQGRPYEIVEWGTQTYKAMRTPGYPLFLAACQSVLGEWPLGVRLVQALLGTASVGIVYLLTRRLDGGLGSQTADRGIWFTAALAAAGIAAIDPYYIAISEVLLSEALFIPLMLASLWGLAMIWRERGEPDRLASFQQNLIAIAAGATGGAAVLCRPSFALFLPCALVCWLGIRVLSRDRPLFQSAVRSALLVAIGFAVVMSPWWIRNARTYGRFVATSVWFGASLYDGLNPGATGASDMRFREAADFRTMGELEQDRVLTRRAIAFVRENPARTLKLAVVKFDRYWSPWPNADEFRSWPLAVSSAVIVIPIYLVFIAGIWDRRRDARALVLLAGPIIYFCAVHLVFVSSIRYRIPGEMAAAALGGIGFRSMLGRVRTTTEDQRSR